jgi:hypothetical protein
MSNESFVWRLLDPDYCDQLKAAAAGQGTVVIASSPARVERARQTARSMESW